MDTDSAKKFSWTAAILLFLIVGLLTAGLSVYVQARNQTIVSLADDPKPVAATTPPVTTVTPATSTALTVATTSFGSSFQAPGQPARLIIPAISVNAAVQSVGLAWAPQNKGDMSVPSNFTDVAWYNGGPLPGMPGSAVIDGHLDGKTVQQAVFYHLGSLRPGDLVEVLDATGKLWQFAVVTSTTYAYDATTTDIFSGDASQARLNLITCAGDWDPSQKLYDKRIVVFTELLSPHQNTPQ